MLFLNAICYQNNENIKNRSQQKDKLLYLVELDLIGDQKHKAYTQITLFLIII